MLFGSSWYTKAFILTLTLFTIVLFFVADTLSISYHEAVIFYDTRNLLYFITHFFTDIFGHNNIALRAPSILFYDLSVVLMYMLTKNYFKHESDRFIAALIFMFLPGIIGASLLVNNSIIVIFCTVLYLYYYKVYAKHNYYMLVIFLFIDNSFAILFLALFFYAFQNRENRLFIVSLILFGLSMYIYGFDTTGKPKSHILDMFAIYASIFSPLIFLYFFYAMYRIGIKGKRSIFWYICITALIFSFLLSFRQKIYIEDFAPFVIITIPIMVKLYFHSLRVRLKRFRTKHYNIAYISFFILFLNVFVILFNKPLYLALNHPQKHFVYNYHFAQEIATILKANGINDVASNNKRLLKRLKFYGIRQGEYNFISLNRLNIYDKKFQINYMNKNLLNVYYVDLKK
ncbi:MAG: glycosyltransferase family 39 protein [Candidatus Marinarcus sp.]|uniref:glycosyltransferase family 39 protein n=1 Tax=Candidatus Marinarcus sp. TaxID=3100987 RepID=UPI003B00CAC9